MCSANACRTSNGAEDPAAMLREKRIERITIRLGDTLKADLKQRARINGTSLSNYLVHLAAMEDGPQAEAGQTSSDIIGELRWVITRLTRVQMVLAGKRRTA